MFLKFISRESKVESGKSNIDFNKFNFFTYSREIIYKILKEINVNSSSEIIVPNYICSTVIDTLYEYTKNIKFYTVNKSLKIDEDEIKALTNNKTKMIIFVDYFGIEAVVNKELINFLKSYNITILKDSAHSFLTLIKHDFNSAYKYDYLVSSIYKNLPLGVGAIAIGDFQRENKFIDKKEMAKRGTILILKKLFCFLGINIINKGIENIIITKDSYASYDNKNNYNNYQKKLSNIDFSKIILKRDALALEFYKYFKDNSLFTLEEIQRSTLQAFPIWCSSKRIRDKILNLMRKECIDAFTWATFHERAVNEYLWEHILLLPLDEKVLQLVKEKVLDV